MSVGRLVAASRAVELHDRRDRRENGPGDGGRPDGRVLPCARAHRADRRRARHEPRHEPRNGEPDAGAEGAQRDVAAAGDRHEDDGEAPERARVQDAERSDRPVRGERQDHEGGRGEDDRVVELLLREHAADEPVEARARGEQGHDTHGEARSEPRLAHGEGPEEHGRDEGHLGREARVPAPRAAVADGDERPDDQGGRDEDGFSAEGEAQPTRERREREGPDSRGRAVGALALAALPLDSDQEADAEGDPEAERQRLGQAAAPVRRGASGMAVDRNRRAADTGASSLHRNRMTRAISCGLGHFE